MKSIFGIRIGACALAAGAVACGGSDAPKVPLGTPQAAVTEAAGPMSGPTGEARVALDSANLLFRAKAYDKALVQYQRSAELAPNEVSPLLGIVMVAEATNNSKLAEATMPRIRKLSPSMADSSLITPHSKMIREHPPIVSPPST